jgi:mannose-6-phosphate isomerase
LAFGRGRPSFPGDREHDVSAHRLACHAVPRIWGRRDLPAAYGAAGDEPIGEIWFEDVAGAPAELLVKLLFTSERLSIQVHPGDAAARAGGHPRGKDEAWLVLAAEPGATIGLGLTRALSADALRAAASDGSIEGLLDWRPVAAGDFFYSPAGTIHAIGGGLSLIEIEQRLDLTYRLYDYGRPRELHLDEAVAVARPGPWSPAFAPVALAPGRRLLAAGGAFTVERRTGGGAVPGGALVVPAVSGGTIDDAALEAGSVWSVDGGASLAGAVDALVAYPGGEVR